MAYMNQEKKAKIKAALDKVMPKGWKYTLSVRNHMAIVCTIKSAPVDLTAECERNGVNLYDRKYVEVNHYYPEDYFDKSLTTFKNILAALNTDNFDHSDAQSDYFHVGHYVTLQIGKWDKPFIVK